MTWEGKELEEAVEMSVWSDECEALAAIYGDQCRIMDERSIEIRVEIPEELAKANNPQLWKATKKEVLEWSFWLHTTSRRFFRRFQSQWC